MLFVLGTWPLETMHPASGIDPSWQAGVAMAYHLHLHWGPAIDFSYGPLGFLTPDWTSQSQGSATAFPLYYATTTSMAIAFAVVLRSATFTLLLEATGEWGVALSALASYLVGATLVTLVMPADQLLALGALLALLVVRKEQDRSRPWLIAALGLTAGVGLLVQLADGVFALGVGLLALVGTRRPRDAGVLLVAFTATIVAVWEATGNRLGDLPSFLRASLAIASGYSAAMQTNLGRSTEWWLAGVVGAVLVTVAVSALRGAGRQRALASALVIAGTCWGLLKEGFIRDDTDHNMVFFGVLCVVVAALAARSPLPRRVSLGLIVVVVTIAWVAATNPPAQDAVIPTLWVFGFGYDVVEGASRGSQPDLLALAIVAVGVLAFMLRRQREGRLLAIGAALTSTVWVGFNFAAIGTLIPAGGVENFVSQVWTVADPSARASLEASSRAYLQQEYSLSPADLAALNGETVAVEPWENTVIWAYPQLRWRPEPVLQAYSAFTSSLDELDARFLSSSDAPARILQRPPAAIDGRVPAFDPPATQIAEMCDYAQLVTDNADGWQVLGRTHDRCGQPVKLRSARVRLGSPVAVPTAPAGWAVVGSFAIPVPATYDLLDFLLKPPAIELVDASGSHVFVVGDADDLHLLRPPSTLGWAGNFSPRPIDRFSLVSHGLGRPTGTFTVTFFAMRVAPSA